jgi:NADH-quinone oxidoreductase subunit I
MHTLNFWQKLYIPEILRGMWVTNRHFWTNLFGRKHTVTQQYPEQPTTVTERYRGRHRLMRKEDGSPRCSDFLLCGSACPALCFNSLGG